MTSALTGPLLDLPLDIRDQVLREVDAILGSTADVEDTSCLLTGSLAEGLGNVRSDIDVYLVFPDASRARMQVTSIGVRADRYVDCEYMTIGGLASVADRVESHADPDVELLRTDVERFYRLAISCQYAVAPPMAPVLARFDKQVACAATATHFARNAARGTARAALVFAHGHRRRAQLMLRAAVIHDATARLAADGEGYPSTKWVFEKASRGWGVSDHRFRDLVAMYGCDDRTTPGLLTEMLERSRCDLTPSSWRAYRIAEGVAYVAGAGEHLLVRGRSAVREVQQHVAGIVSLLSDGVPFVEATAAEAGRLALSPETVRVGVAVDMAELYADGFLEIDEEVTL